MSRLVYRIGRIDTRRAGLLLLGTVGIMAVMGLAAILFDPKDPWFDLDSEVRPRWPLDETTIAFPALWSGFLLVAAGITWLAAAASIVRRGTRLLCGALGAFLLFMATDEVFSWHERIENWTGLDWQVVYAPLVLVMAIAVLVLLPRLWRIDRTSTVLLVAASAMWGLTQVLEYFEWNGDVPIPAYIWLMVPEELGEAIGSILFFLAGVSAVKAARVRTAAPSVVASPVTLEET